MPHQERWSIEVASEETAGSRPRRVVEVASEETAESRPRRVVEARGG
jgi:hypothetical protein